VLEPAYVPAFDLATEVIVAHAHRSEEFSEEERFQPERLVRNIAARKVSARYVPDVDEIVRIVAAEALAGDVVVVMSNGGFGGIHSKLLTALRGRHHG
jgi:UDP-N-acetylmuramate: L-alanyl-gamma-D-glutamyl-meso-diaminopimelate ligase